MSTVNALLGVLIAVVLGGMQFGLHQVPEGSVGIYYRGGALLKSITSPGYHTKIPMVTAFAPIQINIQTDLVRDIPCGTRGGTVITFEKIEVVNRLKRASVYNTIRAYGTNYDKTWIYDKIHHEINQFCSRKTLNQVYIEEFDTVDERLMSKLQKGCDDANVGIDIISIRVTKPRIPRAIRNNYERIEAEKTRYMVANQTKHVVLKEVETIKKKKIAEARKQKEVSAIKMKKKIQEKEAYAKMERIADEIEAARVVAFAEAEVYKKQKEAEGNKNRLTPNYLRQSHLRHLAGVKKTYYGKSIEDAFSASVASGKAV